jgi:N-acyl-D-aspartate/D-glutamate deacylase
MLDLKIINGTIVDGTGRAGYRGDVGVQDGRIVAVGTVDQPARQTIDATGKIVSPGFIDVHTHYDAQVFWDPALTPSSLHGVTTIFGGFCGFSIAPLHPDAGDYLMRMLSHVEGMPLETLQQGVPWDWQTFGEYLGKLEGRLAVNAGFCAGHSAIRRWVMGERAVGHAASPQEVEQMAQLLRESIEQGAMGFSTSLSPTHCDGDGMPVPSRHATREEVLALAKVASEYEGTIVELIPDVANFTEQAYHILTDVSLAAQRPVNWNVVAIQNLSEASLAGARFRLGATDYARERGAEVIALTIPEAPGVRINFYSGFILDALPGWEQLFCLPFAERCEKMRDRAYRRELLASGTSAQAGSMAAMLHFDRLLIAETFSDASAGYRGRTVGEVARETGAEPIDVMFDVALADDLKTSFMPQNGDNSHATFVERAKLWRDDRTVIGGSDAGAHVDAIDTFALTTAVLGRGVREFGVITLEEAVQQLTQKPAQLFGLRERGEIREGWFADLVVFDPATMGNTPTYTRYDLPAGAGRLYSDATGIDHVIVNGTPIVANGELTGATPGRVFHPGRDTATRRIPAAA